MSTLKATNIKNESSASNNIVLDSSGGVAVNNGVTLGTGTTISSPASDTFAVSTNGSERVRVDSSGNINVDSGGVYYDAVNNRLAVGTTSPTAKLEVSGSAGTNPEIRCVDGTVNSQWYAGNDGTCVFGTFSNHPLLFRTNAGERARLDTSGRLLVGTSTSRSNIGGLTAFGSRVQIESTGTDGLGALSLINNYSAGYPAVLTIGATGGSTVGSNTSVNAQEDIGQINFVAADGTNLVRAASIVSFVDGTPGANDMPGRLVFSTTSSGSSSPTERMRITNSGVVDLGHSGGQARLRTNGTSNHQFSLTSSSTTNLVFIQFGRNGTSPGQFTLEGDIRTDGSGNLAFNNASDITCKENIRDLNGCIETINSLRPVLFDWKEKHRAGCTDVKGFIAQEFEQVLPKSISTDENGFKSISPQSELLPLLVGALQEASAKIETLEAKVAALESA